MSSSTRTLRLELSRPIPSIDLADADEVWVLATYQGVPVTRLHLPGPGRCAQSDCLLAAVVGRQAAPQIAFDQVRAHIQRRIGPAPPAEELAVSVVVCTHRRPGPLAMVLRALQDLIPAPTEILVVDNAPGTNDNRVLVERYGAHYVREDSQGLDIARATGVRAARGDVIAFTDDDAIPASNWLRNASRLFADPLVGCVTGPVLPYELATRAQWRYERSASLNRGLVPRVDDWTTLAAALGPELGVGANMLFRRAALQRPELMFPAELDAGTAAESGGDGYALYRMIADGWRVVYDPATYVFHAHRREAEAFHRAVLGYGIGLGSWTATVLSRDHDLGALSLGLSPLASYIATAVERMAGRSDAVDTRAAWDLVRGLAISPVRLRRARRAAPKRTSGYAPADATMLRRSPAISPAGPGAARDSGLVSVVMLDASPAARLCAEKFRLSGYAGVKEVIVPAVAVETPAHGLAAAVASAAGDVVLFWSPALSPEGDVVAAHAAAHAAEIPGVAVGDLRVQCGDSRLASRWRARELSDRAHRVRSAASLTFLDVGDANVSFSIDLLREVGGLDPAFGTGCVREAALRACTAGGVLRRTAARATMVCRSTFTDLIANQREAGEVAAHLSEVYGDTAPILRRIVAEAGPYTAFDRVITTALVRDACASCLAGLERAHMRRRWARTAIVVLSASFRRGATSAPTRKRSESTNEEAFDIESDQLIALSPLGSRPATLRVGGKAAGSVDALRSAWTLDVADEIAKGIQPQAWTGLINAVTRDHSPDEAALPTLTVLLSPTVSPASDLSGQGVFITVLPPSDNAVLFWKNVDEAIRACKSETVALPLPRRVVSRQWAAEVRLALSGSRVGMAAGIGLAEPWAAQPIRLVSECRGERMNLTLTPTDYIAARTSSYAAIGGLSTTFGAVGDQAPPCDLLRRFLGAGGTIAWTAAPGIDSHPGPGHDGATAVVLGAVLTASVRRRDPRAKRLLVLGTVHVVAAVLAERSLRGVLSALRKLVRFSRGVRRGLNLVIEGSATSRTTVSRFQSPANSGTDVVG